MSKPPKLIEDTIRWKPSHNSISINASMDIRVHSLPSNRVVLILPGVDGSVDGYENKYVRMADRIIENQNKAVVRVSNDFITSFHWEDNFRNAVDYINNNAKEYFGSDAVAIEVIAHSAGASVTSWLSHEYPNIDKILLINLAAELKKEKILDGLMKYKGNVNLVFGSNDPSLSFSAVVPTNINVTTINGADHYFSGEHLKTFIKLPDYLE